MNGMSLQGGHLPPLRKHHGESRSSAFDSGGGVDSLINLIDRGDQESVADDNFSNSPYIRRVISDLRNSLVVLAVDPPSSIPFQQLVNEDGVAVHGASRNKNRIYLGRLDATTTTISAGHIYHSIISEMPFKDSILGCLSKSCEVSVVLIAQPSSKVDVIRLECTVDKGGGLVRRTLEFLVLRLVETVETEHGPVDISGVTSISVDSVPILADCARGHFGFCGYAVHRQQIGNEHVCSVSYMVCAEPFPHMLQLAYDNMHLAMHSAMLDVRKLFSAVLARFSISTAKKPSRRRFDSINAEQNAIAEGDEDEDSTHGDRQDVREEESGLAGETPIEFEMGLRRQGDVGQSSVNERVRDCVVNVLSSKGIVPRSMGGDNLQGFLSPPKRVGKQRVQSSGATNIKPGGIIPSRSKSTSLLGMGAGIISPRDYAAGMGIIGPGEMNLSPVSSPQMRRRSRLSSLSRKKSSFMDCQWVPAGIRQGEVWAPMKRLHIQGIMHALADARSAFQNTQNKQKLASLKEMRKVYIALAAHMAMNDDTLFDDDNPLHLALADNYYSDSGSSMSFLKLHEPDYFPQADSVGSVSEFMGAHRRISQLLYRYGALPVGTAMVLSYKDNMQRRKRVGGEIYLRAGEEDDVSWLFAREGDEYIECKSLTEMLARATKKRPVQVNTMALYCEEKHSFMSNFWAHYDSITLLTHAMFDSDVPWECGVNGEGTRSSYVMWGEGSSAKKLEVATCLASLLTSLKSLNTGLHRENFAAWKVFSSQLACAVRVLHSEKQPGRSTQAAMHVLGLKGIWKELPSWVMDGDTPPKSSSPTQLSTSPIRSPPRSGASTPVRPSTPSRNIPSPIEDLPPVIRQKSKSHSLGSLLSGGSGAPLLSLTRPTSVVTSILSGGMASPRLSPEAELRPERMCAECPVSKTCVMSMDRKWRDLEETARLGAAKNLLSLSW